MCLQCPNFQVSKVEIIDIAITVQGYRNYDLVPLVYGFGVVLPF